MISKHFKDIKIDVYRHNKLSSMIGYHDQYQKTKMIGISKNNIIRVLSGYDLGVDHEKIMRQLSKFYNLSIEDLERMYRTNVMT